VQSPGFNPQNGKKKKERKKQEFYTNSNSAKIKGIWKKGTRILGIWWTKFLELSMLLYHGTW
jgi:hypothetical protein